MNKEEDVKIYIPTRERVISSSEVIVTQELNEQEYNELPDKIIAETLNQLADREAALILKPKNNKQEM